MKPKFFLHTLGALFGFLLLTGLTPVKKVDISSAPNCTIKYEILNESSYDISVFKVKHNGVMTVYQNIPPGHREADGFEGPAETFMGAVTLAQQPTGPVSVTLYIDLGGWNLSYIGCAELGPNFYQGCLVPAHAKGGCLYKYVYIVSDGPC